MLGRSRPATGDGEHPDHDGQGDDTHHDRRGRQAERSGRRGGRRLMRLSMPHRRQAPGPTPVKGAR